MSKLHTSIKNTLFIIAAILFLSFENVQAATCNYTLTISDSYGDGWDGEIKVQKNCGAGWVDVIGWQSETGYGPTNISFSVDDADGCSYRLRYRDNGGLYPYEEFFDVYDAYGTLVVSGVGADGSPQNILFTPNCSAPTCSDGIQNQGETGIDCGGPCAACPPSCTDGIQNQGETGIDCGGPCAPCPVVSSCASLGFDDVASTYTGTHSTWTTLSGRNNVSGSFTIEGPIATTPIVDSPFNEHCDLRPGNDPTGGFCYFDDGTIPVPNGSQNVIRLGAFQQIGMDASGMRTTFTVTEPYLVYYYILGFESTGHTVNNRGFCTFEIKDNGGTVLPCGSFQVYENGPNENWTFHTTTNDVWLMDDWRTVTLDVSSHIGQDLTIEVWVADCQEGAHSGFGYFDFECLSAAIPDCGIVPLSVELTSFYADCNTNYTTLNWSTSSEENNDYFTILRSSDGEYFEEIGTVPGSGTSNQAQNYSWVSPERNMETQYYKLRQTDFNGNNEEFNAISAHSCSEQNEGAYFDINNTLHIKGKNIMSASVYDTKGKLIINETTNTNASSNELLIFDTNASTGIYLVSVQFKDGHQEIMKVYHK